ncbi:sensor histidine kinase [Ferruginibacter sp. HRS2-29]|uniref:sensor histidine kinase n=1 Tax=Ferruginibacter sp. HRS2-29 TaxID=2487334 RepID=UPI0020CE91D0|nr:histidine kinase [Ferruginibacter sp. HRS2-29]
MKKWLPVLIHVTAWILLFSLPYLLRPTYNPDEAKRKVETNAGFIVARINDLLLVCLFYLNVIVLMPGLFYKKRHISYLLSLIACFAFLFFSSFYLNLKFNNPSGHLNWRWHLLFCTFAFLFILACSIAYKTIRDKVIADALIKEKENENLKTELSLLRSQVSPHFMFNVLNNMVSLARKQSDLLEPSLIKLSSLMRYMLYETGEEKVSLEKETEYLQSYIDLQQQRFGKKVVVTVSIAEPDRSYEIEPMLLIPFVENAFKHGTGMIEDAQIDIALKAQNNTLDFSVSNRYTRNSTEEKDKSSGIGLPNVQRRLELLYGNKQHLEISKNEYTFTVQLQIQLT